MCYKSLFSCPKMTECKFETGMFFLFQVPQHAYPVNPRQGGSQRRVWPRTWGMCVFSFVSMRPSQKSSSEQVSFILNLLISREVAQLKHMHLGQSLWWHQWWSQSGQVLRGVGHHVWLLLRCVLATDSVSSPLFHLHLYSTIQMQMIARVVSDSSILLWICRASWNIAKSAGQAQQVFPPTGVQRKGSQCFQPWQDDFLIFKLNVRSHFKSLHICDALSCCHSKQLLWTVSYRIADDIGNKNNKLCLQETEYNVMNMLCPSLVRLDVHCNLGHFYMSSQIIPKPGNCGLYYQEHVNWCQQLAKWKTGRYKYPGIRYGWTNFEAFRDQASWDPWSHILQYQ